MKNDKLIDAIGRVEEDLIYEAEVSVPRYQPSAMERLRDWFASGSSLMRGGAVAVCAVLLIAVGLTIGHWQMGTKKADMTAEGSNEAAGETSSEAKAIEEEKAVEEAPKGPTEAELLTEIRDLLKEKNS